MNGVCPECHTFGGGHKVSCPIEQDMIDEYFAAVSRHPSTARLDAIETNSREAPTRDTDKKELTDGAVHVLDVPSTSIEDADRRNT